MPPIKIRITASASNRVSPSVSLNGTYRAAHSAALSADSPETPQARHKVGAVVGPFLD